MVSLAGTVTSMCMYIDFNITMTRKMHNVGWLVVASCMGRSLQLYIAVSMHSIRTSLNWSGKII